MGNVVRPLISYVCTTYNCVRFVGDAVKSALEQTYSPLEIIFSDDCSTDGTFEEIKRLVANYHGPHKVILNQNERNLGISQHMNKAYIELPKGEIIIAAHGDDMSKPERTSVTYEFLRTHPDVTAVSFGLIAIDENGNRVPMHDAVVKRIHYYEFRKGGGNIPAHSRAFYKKVMVSFGPLEKDCPTEDELITNRALLLGKNAFLPECMVTYRKHSGSMSNPENFSKFPLDKIIKQENKDMIKAVKDGLISEEERKNYYDKLKNSSEIRAKYRVFFSIRNLSSLLDLLRDKRITVRGRLKYIKQYISFLMHK